MQFQASNCVESVKLSVSVVKNISCDSGEDLFPLEPVLTAFQSFAQKQISKY